jgi:hypothetical protein
MITQLNEDYLLSRTREEKDLILSIPKVEGAKLGGTKDCV